MPKETIFELSNEELEHHFKHEFHKPANLLTLAESKKQYHTMGLEIPVLVLSKLHPKLLKTYLNRIITIDFEGKFKDVLDHVVSHIVVSDVKEMKPDKSEALFSDFTPLVRRRLTNIANVLFLKKDLPISEILMVVDYFKGSAPIEIDTKKAEKKLEHFLMEHFTKKNPRSVTGLLMNGPKNTYILVAFHMDYGKEAFGFKKARSKYKELLDLAHEDEAHMV